MRRQLINLLLLAAVGAAAVLVWNGTREVPAEPLIATPISGLQSAGFERSDGQRVMLQRRADGWWLSEPVSAPADPAEVNRLLGVAEATVAQRFALSEVDADGLGLAAPHYRLHFDATEVAVGGLNPITRQRYLLIGEQVIQISDPAGLPPPNAHAQLLHKELLAGADAPLVAVRIGNRALLREDGAWRAQHPDREIAPRVAAAAAEAWASLRAMWTRSFSGDALEDAQLVELELADGTRVALYAKREQQLLLQRADYRSRYHVARDQAPLLLDFRESAPTDSDAARAGEGVLAPPP